MVDFVAPSKTSFGDYLTLTEAGDHIVQLIDGEIVVDAPFDDHQRALWQLVFVLAPHLMRGEPRFAPCTVYFDEKNSFQPDLFWVSPENDHCTLASDHRYWIGAPDLVVEVLSPSTSYNDRRHKFLIYEKYGVREYWLLDPLAQHVEVFTLQDAKLFKLDIYRPGDSFTSPLLGAAVDLERVFKS